MSVSGLMSSANTQAHPGCWGAGAGTLSGLDELTLQSAARGMYEN